MAEPPSALVWYEALAAPVGIVVRTDDHYEYRQKMDEIRTELADADLDQISVEQLVDPNSPNDLWFVKRNLANDPTQAPLRPAEGDPEPPQG